MRLTRAIMLAFIGGFVFATPAPAQVSGSLTTIFAANNNNSVNGGNYFDANVLNSGGLSGMNLCSGGVTGNPGAYGVASCGSTKSAFSGIPSQMQIVYAGTGSIGTTGAPFAAVVYAPNAPVSTSGAAVGFYGSIVASTFSEGSKAPVHYDNALATSQAPIVGPFQPSGFTWSKN